MVLISESELTTLRQLADSKTITTIEKTEPVEIKILNEREVKNEQDLTGIEEQIIQSLPSSMQKRGRRILNHIKLNPSVLSVSENGSLKLKDEEILGSNVTDLLSDLLITLKRKYTPTGMEDFLRALSLIHTPLSWITNPRRRSAMAKIRGRIPKSHKKVKTISRKKAGSKKLIKWF